MNRLLCSHPLNIQLILILYQTSLLSSPPPSRVRGPGHCTSSRQGTRCPVSREGHLPALPCAPSSPRQTAHSSCCFERRDSKWKLEQSQVPLLPSHVALDCICSGLNFVAKNDEKMFFFHPDTVCCPPRISSKCTQDTVARKQKKE